MGTGDRQGIAFVVVAACLWATVGVATQLVPQAADLGPEFLSFTRTAVAAPVLLGIALVVRGKPVQERAALCPKLLSVFALCSVIFQIGLFRSFALIGVSLTVFLTVCLPPVIAALLTVFWRRERIGGAVAAALFLALAGLSLLVARAVVTGVAATGATGSQDGGAALVGVALSVAASVAFVGMSVSARRLGSGSDPVMVAALGLGMSSLLMVPLVALGGPYPDFTPQEAWNLMLLVCYLGLVPTALAYFCFVKGMARCRSAVTGLVASMVEPMVAMFFAVLLLGERLAASDLAACLLLMASMCLLSGNRARVAVAVPVTVTVGVAVSRD